MLPLFLVLSAGLFDILNKIVIPQSRRQAKKKKQTVSISSICKSWLHVGDRETIVILDLCAGRFIAY